MMSYFRHNRYQANSTSRRSYWVPRTTKKMYTLESNTKLGFRATILSGHLCIAQPTPGLARTVYDISRRTSQITRDTTFQVGKEGLTMSFSHYVNHFWNGASSVRL